MTLVSVLQFWRVLLVFGVALIAIPLLAASRPNRADLVHQIAAGFVRVCLFFEIAVLALGWCRLNFSGILTAAFILWIGANILSRCRRRALTSGQAVQAVFLRSLVAIERGWRRDFSMSMPRQQLSPFSVFFALLMTTALLQRAWFPLHNFRFVNIDTYSRTLSLQQFIHGHRWQPDGSVALFAPLVLFSGLQPDCVVRFAGPVFSTLTVLAAGLCAFRFARSRLAAYFACAFSAVLPLFAGIDRPLEATSAEMSALFWVLAAAFAGRSWRLAVYAAATALLIHASAVPALGVALGVAVVSVLSGIAAVRIGAVLLPPWRPAAGGLAATGLILGLFTGFDSTATEGPFQYESAARASFDIARNFRRNDWLIVSPVHELAFTYGRGWHMELLDFVTSFTTAQISSPGFSLPYPVRDLFIFVEKEPLRSSSRIDLTQTMDRAVLAYGTGTGRASVQFQAAALISAYASSHSDVSTFYEDERLVIYHISKEGSNVKSAPRA